MLAFEADALRRAGFPYLGRRFLLWRTFTPRREGGNPVKSPCGATGYGIDGTDERLWLDFDRAATMATQRRLGLGIALGWGVGGLDLDRCRDERGGLSELATRIVRHFATYVEVSPSGTGVKAFFVAGPRFTATVKVDAKGIELYAGRRFFALTGRALDPTQSIGDCTAAACTLAEVLRPSRQRPAYTGPSKPLVADAREMLDRCEIVRERPSTQGGVVYTLRRCPFTGDEHAGGGPYAVAFPDGGLHLRCERSSHGPQKATLRASRGRR